MSWWKKAGRSGLAHATGAIVVLAAATPAHAITAAGIPLALASGTCASVAFPIATEPGRLEAVRALKSEAILEGAPSALERIRMSQAASAVSAANLAAPEATGREKRTGVCFLGAPSPEQAPQLTSIVESSNSPPNFTGRSDVFLASPRIPIARTRFDNDWTRVSSKHLSVNLVVRSMGAPLDDRIALIGQVNRWANRTITYRPDSRGLNGGDYWADARLTLRTGAGDCEDIAILKYQALLSLGIAPGDMYFTIAYDLARHADHALLVVRQEGRYFLLDDSTDELLDGSQPNDYRPILSFGEGKWLHGLQATPQPVIYLSRNELSSPRVIGVVR